jgi:xylose isomerase
MKDMLRFAIAYWHSFCGDGSDTFGAKTRDFPYDGLEGDERIKVKLDMAFEFFDKIGAPFYCFHDTDLVGDGSVFEIEKRLEKWVPVIRARQKQAQSGSEASLGHCQCLLSSQVYERCCHQSRFHGASLGRDVQVKNALDATIALGGQNYVFWGGREGYMSLLNTDMKREQDHLAMIPHMAKDYARKNGFKGPFLIEPKPMEPTKHQYDYDTATVIGFLRQIRTCKGLQDERRGEPCHAGRSLFPA